MIKCKDCGEDFEPANPRYIRCPRCAKFFREHHRPYGAIEPDQKFMVSSDGSIINRRKTVCNYIKKNVNNAVSREDPESIFFSPGFISKFIPEVVLCDTEKIIKSKENATHEHNIGTFLDEVANNHQSISFLFDTKEIKLSSIGLEFAKTCIDLIPYNLDFKLWYYDEPVHLTTRRLLKKSEDRRYCLTEYGVQALYTIIELAMRYKFVDLDIWSHCLDYRIGRRIVR